MTSVCLQGNCLQLMKGLENKSVDLFVCDLPYGCLKPQKKVISKCLHTSVWDEKIDLDEFWIQIKRLCKNDKTPVIMFCSTKFGNDLINSNPSWFRYDLILNKNRGAAGFLSANKMPLRSHELIYVFSKKGANYNRLDEHVEGKKAYTNNQPERNGGRCYTLQLHTPVKQTDGKRCPLSVINIKMNEYGRKHPTAKPIEIYDWIIKRYSNEGDTVLDPTAGSFNSGVSALALNRNYIGMELNEEYYNKNKLD